MSEKNSIRNKTTTTYYSQPDLFRKMSSFLLQAFKHL